jgi:hypothetical protein
MDNKHLENPDVNQHAWLGEWFPVRIVIKHLPTRVEQLIKPYPSGYFDPES